MNDHLQDMVNICQKIGFDASQMSFEACSDVYFVGVHPGDLHKLDSMTLQERLEFREVVRERVTLGPVKFLPDLDLAVQFAPIQGER